MGWSSKNINQRTAGFLVGRSQLCKHPSIPPLAEDTQQVPFTRWVRKKKTQTHLEDDVVFRFLFRVTRWKRMTLWYPGIALDILYKKHSHPQFVFYFHPNLAFRIMFGSFRITIHRWTVDYFVGIPCLPRTDSATDRGCLDTLNPST